MPKTSRKRKIAAKDSWRQDDSLIGWFDLPLEMREMVIDEMDIKTRCKFAQCSKKCEDEVKTSKKFLTGIELSRFDDPTIHVLLGESPAWRYQLKFCDLRNKNEPKFDLIYDTVYFRTRFGSVPVKWKERRNGSAEEARINYLNEIMKTGGKRIERFQIHDKIIVISKLDMKQLTNLNYFWYDWGDIRQNGLIELSQINKIDKCYLEGTQFTFEEFLQFEGSSYTISSDDFNNENIEKYLKMFKNGEIHRNMEYIFVFSYYYRENVNCKKLAKSLDGFDFGGDNEDFWFRFLLNYERKQKCYCYVEYSENFFSVEIQSRRYDEVMENRQLLID